MKSELIQQWRSQILSKEVAFLAPPLQKAVKFLLSSKNAQGVWGSFVGLPTDIHVSSLCMEALSTTDPVAYAPAVENAVLVFRDAIMDSHHDLSVSDLADSLRILSSPRLRSSEDQRLLSEVIDRIRELRKGFGWGYPEPSVTITAEVLLAVQRSTRQAPKFFDEVLASVVALQRSDDGGWPVTPGGATSWIASALMLRLLSAPSRSVYLKSKSSCARYFEKQLTDKGWGIFKEAPNMVFLAASVLRALGKDRDFPYQIVKSGIEFLYNESKDGVWADQKGGSPSIELTAVAVLALCAAGENKVTSSRLAVAALDVADASLAQLVHEREELAGNIQTLVRKEIDQVMLQRDRLAKKAEELEADKRTLTTQLQSAQENISNLQATVSRLADAAENLESMREVLRRPLREQSSRATLQMLPAIIQRALPFLAVGVLGLMTIPLLDIFRVQFLSKLPITVLVITRVSDGVISISLVLYGIWLAVVDVVRREQYIVERRAYTSAMQRPDPALFLEEMQSVIREWPPSKREEFIYRLMKSPKIASGEEMNYGRYLADRFSDNESQERRLMYLVAAFVQLPELLREELTDRLRRYQWRATK